MKLEDLFEAKKYKIENSFGVLSANFKTDLLEEEDEDYLPEGYNPKKVIELDYVEAKELGQGFGDKLMEEFLASSFAKSAELIFCDPNPNMGKFENSSISDNEQIAKLQRFYAKHGFRHAPRANRMWRVQKGKIETSDLPT